MGRCPALLPDQVPLSLSDYLEPKGVSTMTRYIFAELSGSSIFSDTLQGMEVQILFWLKQSPSAEFLPSRKILYPNVVFYVCFTESVLAVM